MLRPRVCLRLESLEDRHVPSGTGAALAPGPRDVGPTLVAARSAAMTFSDERGALGSALNLTRAALGSYGLSAGFGKNEDAEALTWRNRASPLGGAAWNAIVNARVHILQAAALFEQARRTHAPQQGNLVRDGNEHMKTAKALVAQADAIFKRIVPTGRGGVWYIYTSAAEYQQLTGQPFVGGGAGAVTGLSPNGVDVATVFASPANYTDPGLYAHERAHMIIFTDPQYRGILGPDLFSQAAREKLAYRDGYLAVAGNRLYAPTYAVQYNNYLQAVNFLNKVAGTYTIFDGSPRLYTFQNGLPVRLQ
ncbi:MAG: hypothetical protein U0746_17745 [Gemmataceae bacterium]